MHNALEQIKDKMDKLAEESPSVPSKFKAKIDARLMSKRHKRIYDLKPAEMLAGDK